jgi:hypothetical protein
MQKSSPVFISGYNKSGTTLFLSLLDNHPQLVVMPEELHFFRTVLFAGDRLAAVRNATGFRMFTDDSYLAAWSQGKSWFEGGYPEYDKKRFCAYLNQLAVERLAARDLLIGLFECFARADNIELGQRRHWASKTTQDEINFPIMREMFKDFHFFYIIRDSRDVWVSYMKRKDTVSGGTGDRQSELVAFASEWKVQVNQAQKFSNHHPNFHVFRYEDVICKTSEVVGRVADLLDINFEQILLRPTRHGKPWGGNSVFADGFKTLSTDPIGRYEKVLPLSEKECLEAMLQKELADFRYSLAKAGMARQEFPLAIMNSYRRILLATRLRYFLKQKLNYLRYRILVS